MIEAGQVTSRRALRDHYHEAMKDAIASKRADVPGGEWDGVPVVTEKDLFDSLATIFFGPPPEAGDDFAEVVTPANVLVHAECPRCGIPAEINVQIGAVLTVDSDGAELSAKSKGKARTHVCGQLPLPTAGETIAGDQMNLSDWIGPTTQELVLTVMETAPADYATGEETCGAEVTLPDEEAAQALSEIVFAALQEVDDAIETLECGRTIDHPDDHYAAGFAWRYETIPVPQGIEGNESASVDQAEEGASDGEAND